MENRCIPSIGRLVPLHDTGVGEDPDHRPGRKCEMLRYIAGVCELKTASLPQSFLAEFQS